MNSRTNAKTQSMDYFDDPLGAWQKINDLLEGMIARKIAWSPKNRSILIAELKEFLKNNKYIEADKKYLYGISLTQLITRLFNSIEHPNRPIKAILMDLQRIMEEIRKEHMLRLETFEDFAQYIISHRLIASNKINQRVSITFSEDQYRILKYGFSQGWDLRLVKELIKKIRNTDEVELFRAEDLKNNRILIFYRYYEENLRDIEPEITFTIFPDKNSLTLSIPLMRPQVDLFENEIKELVRKKIIEFYAQHNLRPISPRPIIQSIHEYPLDPERTVCEIKFLYLDLSEEAESPQSSNLKMKDDSGFNIML